MITKHGNGIVNNNRICRVNTSVESPFYTSGGGQGKLMFLDELFCNGTENRLDECPHVGRYQEDCSYTQAVGVYCMNATEDDLDYKQGTLIVIAMATSNDLLEYK